MAGLPSGRTSATGRCSFAAGSQYSLGKSRRGFGPIGPWLVTADELGAPDDLVVRCSVNGEIMQEARTSDLIFSVPRLVAELSSVVPLLPGDVIFTGTPSGVGIVRQPPRFLRPETYSNRGSRVSARSATHSCDSSWRTGLCRRLPAGSMAADRRLPGAIARHHHQRHRQRHLAPGRPPDQWRWLGDAGMGLARLEGHAVLSALVRRVARIDLAGKP